MAYEPINWQAGDTITSARLNRMDRGWGFETTELFSETVTTAVDPEHPDWGAFAQLAYSQLIDADSITVTFDGTEYTCPRTDSGTYGAPWSDELNANDFSVYPFYIFSDGSDPAGLVTQTAGEHTVAAGTASIETSSSFDSAVVLAGVFEVVQGTTTFQEACDAFKSGKHVCVVSNSVSGEPSRGPVILVNENTFQIKFVSTMNSDTQIALSGLSASSADGVLE